MSSPPAEDPPVDEPVAVIEAAIADLFRMANDPRMRTARQRRAGVDLSATALEVLRRVDDLGPLAVTAVADVVGLSLASTSRTLAELERRGLLERRGDPDDGRVARFEATRAGRATRRRFQRATQDDIATVLDEWPVDDRRRLAELFRRMVNEMQQGVR